MHIAIDNVCLYGRVSNTSRCLQHKKTWEGARRQIYVKRSRKKDRNKQHYIDIYCYLQPIWPYNQHYIVHMLSSTAHFGGYSQNSEKSDEEVYRMLHWVFFITKTSMHVNWVFVIGSESVEVFYRLFLYVLPLEIQLSREEGWDPINRFNSAILLCLSQARTWISNVVVFVVFSEFSSD
jgi:hypothetical protein